MPRIFTVEKGLFVGGWGDRDSVRSLNIYEHSDLTLEEIKKDYPSFFGSKSKLVCRWQAQVKSSVPFGFQKRQITLVSGGSAPVQGGGQLKTAAPAEALPLELVHGAMTFDNGCLAMFKCPGFAPHSYTITDVEGDEATTQAVKLDSAQPADVNVETSPPCHVVQRTNSLLCSTRWAFEQAPSSGTSLIWSQRDGRGEPRDQVTNAWVIDVLLDAQGQVAAKIYSMFKVGAIQPFFYAIEIGPGDSYGARSEGAVALPRALLFSLAMIHSYEYDRRTWNSGGF